MRDRDHEKTVRLLVFMSLRRQRQDLEVSARLRSPQIAWPSISNRMSYGHLLTMLTGSSAAMPIKPT